MTKKLTREQRLLIVQFNNLLERPIPMKEAIIAAGYQQK